MYIHLKIDRSRFKTHIQTLNEDLQKEGLAC